MSINVIVLAELLLLVIILNLAEIIVVVAPSYYTNPFLWQIVMFWLGIKDEYKFILLRR